MLEGLGAFIAGGGVTWLALAILLGEFVVLVLLKGRGALPYLPNILSGACLVLALRAALIDAGWAAVAFPLAMGFLAHLADLVSRLRRR